MRSFPSHLPLSAREAGLIIKSSWEWGRLMEVWVGAPHWTRALLGTHELNLSLKYLKLLIPSSPRDKSQTVQLRTPWALPYFSKNSTTRSLHLWRFYGMKAHGGGLRIRIKYFIMTLNLWVFIIHREPSHFIILEPLSMVQKQLQQGMYLSGSAQALPVGGPHLNSGHE